MTFGIVLVSLLIQGCATPCAGVSGGTEKSACLVTWYEQEYPDKYRAILKKHGITEDPAEVEPKRSLAGDKFFETWASVRADVARAAEVAIEDRSTRGLNPVPVPAARMGF